jgi:hypothetical protein
MDRRINQLNRQLYQRRMEDLAHEQRNYTTAWIPKLGGKWKILGFLRLKTPQKTNQVTTP